MTNSEGWLVKELIAFQWHEIFSFWERLMEWRHTSLLFWAFLIRIDASCIQGSCTNCPLQAPVTHARPQQSVRAVIPPSKVRLSQAHITTCVQSNKWQPWPSCTKAYSRTNILALMKEGKVETLITFNFLLVSLSQSAWTHISHWSHCACRLGRSKKRKYIEICDIPENPLCVNSNTRKFLSVEQLCA